MNSNSSLSSNSLPKYSNDDAPLKLISLASPRHNAEYVFNEIAELLEVNESYNKFVHFFQALKDFPLDTKVVIKLYGSTSENGPYEIISEGWTIALADTNHKYHKYLPKWLIDVTKSTGQILKGRYGNTDFGYFKFYKILPEKELNYPYIKMTYDFEAPNVVIFNCVYIFKKL